ncbi:MAG TPA: rhodanese-like domain-containing protein [Chitinophagaceae bacterium]|nr:rhodanese-like domain-containing protein [Chitinophagaceae bacterium]
MLGFLFGKKKIKEAIKNGARVIDVRTPHEFDQGKVPGSVNIPVDRITANIARIKGMNKPIVLCCESGMRSSTAKQILKSNGLKEVLNGRSWRSVLKISNTL